ncbi:MAG: CPBP family intramembrane glutamic endopeptidase [Planctomycetota bacterium]
MFSANERARASAPANTPSMQARESYLAATHRPIHVLLFLLPLILIYEFASLWADPEVTATGGIAAERALTRVFEAFGAVGPHTPAIALVIVLVVWQILVGRGWKPRPVVLFGMGFESVMAAVPLVILGTLLSPGPTPEPAVVAASGSAGSELIAKLHIAVGAGIYEELLFRLVGIAAAHFILGDLIRMPRNLATSGAVLISALAFAFYHDPFSRPGGGQLFVFYLLAGLYFGALFVGRGFGIAVATHAIYDVFALVIADN